MDAVYTLQKYGCSSFTIDALIELCFGDAACNSSLRDECGPLFISSIEKLSHISVVYGKQKRIGDGVYGLPTDAPACVLPVTNCVGSSQIYEIVGDLPLYTVAESIGSIVGIDRQLLDVEDFNDCFWKKLIRFELIKAIEIAKGYPTTFGVSIFYKQPSSQLTSRCMLGAMRSTQCLIDVYDSVNAIKDADALHKTMKEIHAVCEVVLDKLIQGGCIIAYDCIKVSNKYVSVDVKLKEDADKVMRSWDEITHDETQVLDTVNKTYDDEYDEVDAAIDELRNLQADLLIEQMKAIKDLLGIDYCDSRLINVLQVKVKTSFYKIGLLLKQKRKRIAKYKIDK